VTRELRDTPAGERATLSTVLNHLAHERFEPNMLERDCVELGHDQASLQFVLRALQSRRVHLHIGIPRHDSTQILRRSCWSQVA
jgi:hypothetical protein